MTTFLKLGVLWYGIGCACTQLGQAQENSQRYNLREDVAWPGEVNGPKRIWTPAKTQPAEPGVLQGPPFIATLKGVFNEETQFSNEFAIFELEDGRVQGYETRAFTPEDLEVIHKFRAQLPAEPDDPKKYILSPTDQDSQLLKDKQISLVETQHFAFWFGHDVQGDAASLLKDPRFVTRAAEWYEKIWRHYDSEVQAPMPYHDESQGKKINVVLSDSGYPGATGWANSAEAMGLDPRAMQYGSSVVPHEFCHVIQFYSGGFRESPTVGYFWETHANFGAFTYEPTVGYDLNIFYQQIEYGPQWTDSRYGNWPFLMHLYEKKKTRSLVFDIWLKNRRDADGHTIEDPLQTMVRLGEQTGALPNGWASLGDEWGEMAVRLVTWDYIHHTYYEAATKDLQELAYVKLKATGSENHFASPEERPLRAYGIHFVHLATAGNSTVKVEFAGKTDAQGASWRLGLVAVDPSGKPRYSVIKRVDGQDTAMVTLAVKPDEKLTLAIMATPLNYRPVPWGEKPATLFPYEIAVDGAKPEFK